MPLGCVFNCILTPSFSAQNLQAPVENLGPILSLNKLWNAPGMIVNLSPLQTKCPNSHLPSEGSHRALGVLHSPPPGMRGQLDHYICTKNKQRAQLCTEGWKKGGSPNIDHWDNLFVWRVFKTYKHTPAGYKWSPLCNYHSRLKNSPCGFSLETLWWVTPYRLPW